MARNALEGPLRLFIDGQFEDADTVAPTFDPATGDAFAEAPVASPEQVDRAVTSARRAASEWRATAPTKKARLMWRLAELIDNNAASLAELEVLDNGKPVGEAAAVDIPLTAELLRYYSGWTTKIAGDVLPNSVPGMLSMNWREPVGVVAALAPWNFPLLELCYKLGPALAAGCTVVAKPSEWTPVSALRLGELIDEAGFPAGVVNVVNGGPDVGAALVSHTGVDKVAFTGQTGTGQEIMRAAADDLKLVSLSLGAKSPNIVFADADLDAATAGVFGGVFFNQGQACVAGSRLLVHASVADRIERELVSRAGNLRLGAGMDPATQMGPLVSAPHRSAVLRHVEGARDAGARVATGGRAARVDGLQGYFMEPTVLSDVTPDMAVAQEEVFGPVLSILRWEDEEELVALANDTRFGLAAGIWTADVGRAVKLAESLNAGTVWINTYGMFDVAVPFGGRRHSGRGRELGDEALESYLQRKSVWVDLDQRVQSSGQGVGG